PNQTNWIETTVIGPANVSFWWKVSSATNHGRYRFSVNGVARAEISGEVDWQWRTFDVDAGNQVLRWSYTKDFTAPAGQDRGWLDQVLIGPAAPIITNQPSKLIVVDEGTTVKFRTDSSGTPPFSYQWRFNGTNLVDSTNVIGATGSRNLVLTNVTVPQS